MPLKGVPVCIKCETHDSPMWTNAEGLGVLCLDCVNEARSSNQDNADDETDIKDEKGKQKKQKTTRSYKTRLNPFALAKNVQRGRGRRAASKKTPVKAPEAVATTITSDYVFYKVRIHKSIHVKYVKFSYLLCKSL